MNTDRKTEIYGWISAYRNGWVEYDRKHVAELVSELNRLRDKLEEA